MSRLTNHVISTLFILEKIAGDLPSDFFFNLDVCLDPAQEGADTSVHTRIFRVAPRTAPAGQADHLVVASILVKDGHGATAVTLKTNNECVCTFSESSVFC